ncbi:minor capsid protein [Allobaculum fili]|uniref:minor capsid protein n=1 Tax=Allobaculum fili TaxID=2834460 RepID=UPI001E39FB08|nr:minor capsid protein [Allobaculum fili]
MASSKYWQEREDDWTKECQANNVQWHQKLQDIYQTMNDEISEQIAVFYQKYADENGLTYALAKQYLDRTDIRYYFRLAKRYCEDAAKDMAAGTWAHDAAKSYFTQQADQDMKRYNTAMKIARLDMLKRQISLRIANAQRKACSVVEDALNDRILQTYTRQAGILGDTVLTNLKHVSTIAHASFHGATFSDRIWGTQQAKLKKVLNKALQDCLILGKGAAPFTRELKKATGKTTRECQRLISTELSRVRVQASLDSFKACGFDEFQIIANPDCCKECQAINGEHFPLPRLASGENAPPMHPNCRCSIAPYEARDEDGDKDFDEAAFDEWCDYMEEHEDDEDALTWEEWEAQNHEIEFKAHQEEQEYKTVSLNAEQPETFTTNFREERKAYPIEERKNWYVEEGVHVKSRQVHEVNKAVQTAMKAHGLSDLGNTKIIIVNDTTLSTGALAAYDPVQDVLKLGYYLTNKTAFELDPNDKSLMPHNLDVTMIHELFHWKDAKEYREKICEITQETRNEYFSYRHRYAEEKVLKYLPKYDLENISAYSAKTLGLGKYDEVYTELRTFLLSGGRYEQIRRKKIT